MNGKITGRGSNGLFAAITEEGDITIFEMFDTHEPEIGDQISGDLDASGGVTLLNVTQQTRFDVFNQYIHCSRAQAVAILSG